MVAYPWQDAASATSGAAALQQEGFDLLVSTWPTGGYARPGGVYVYGIYYRLDGDVGVTAENVVIVDTLPPHTSYAADTSGITPVQGPGTVSWNLGTLEAGDYGLFMVTLGVDEDTPTGGDALADNCASIDTTSAGDWDPWNDLYCSGVVGVWDDEVELSVDKWPEPGDPTPGQEFRYRVQWCNNRGAAAGPVVLTDTLPAGTALVRWEHAQWWQPFWTEVSSSANQLLLQASGLPGWTCQDLYLTVLLDPGVEIGAQLQNLVAIAVAGDVEPGNNWRLNGDAYASEPRPDLGMGKWFNTGVLAPGGWAEYGVGAWNQGNVALNVGLTDTLPAGTEYIAGSAQMGGEPFDPDMTSTEEVVWEAVPVGVAQGPDFSFRVSIPGDLVPPQLLTNCITGQPDVEETTPWDNEACVEVMVYDHGPNLHVEKWSEWQGDQIYYNLSFTNLGDEPVSQVHITDTYPVGTTSYPWEHWPSTAGNVVITTTSNYTGNQWLFLAQELQPGESGWIDFWVTVEDPGLRPAWYTNTVEIDTPPDDANPDDNQDRDVIVLGEVTRVEVFLEPDDRASMWGEAMPGTELTVTAPGGTFTTTVGREGCDQCWDLASVGVLYPGDEVTVQAGNGDLPVVLQIPDPFTAVLDREAGTVSGEIGGWPERRVDVNGSWEDGWRFTSTDAAGHFEVSYDSIPRGAEGSTYIETEINHAVVTFQRRFVDMALVLQVNYDHDWVEGNYLPGYTVWLTVTGDTGAVKATVELPTQEIPWWDGGTGFSTSIDELWVPEHPDIRPGDFVHGRVSTGYTATVQIGTITGQVDAGNDSVGGTVLAGWLDVDEVDVECHSWGGPGGVPSKRSTAGPDGDPPYFCQWDPVTEWDMQAGQQIGVSYAEPDGDRVFAVFEGPWLRVNYGHDWAGGNYPAGQTFWITVTDSLGVDKGFAVVETTQWGGWNGPGFETRSEDWESGSAPDIIAGDSVRFRSSDGYAQDVQVGEITGNLNIPYDLVEGTITAAGFDPPLHGWCSVWVDQGPYHGFDFHPGGGSYLCDLTQYGWDLTPGQTVAVGYVEPDGDQVMNTFEEPAPYLQVQKWADGQLGEGGNYRFYVQYQNAGSGVAPNVVLTDTMEGLTYLSDTSGLSPTGSGSGPIVWQLGSVEPGGWIQFEVFVQVTAAASETVTNTVEIATSDPFDQGDPGEKVSTWTGHVEENDTHLNVGKWSWTGDPAPDTDVVFQVQVCNNGSTASSELTLVDTLDPALTLQRWWGENPGWQEASSNLHQLVLTHPSIPSYWCGSVYVVAHVAPWAEVGTHITNLATISAGTDLDLDDNESFWEAWVSAPHTNLWVDKGWGSGQLVPGGEIRFWINYGNGGNVPVAGPILITDTLPAGTSFLGAWRNEPWGQEPLDPVEETPGTVIWDVGGLENGYGGSFEVALRVGEGVAPGTVLTNTAEISPQPEEDSYDDNADGEAVRINDHGPNLRARKWHQWHGDGRLHYELQVENVGDEPVYGVVLTDVYPDGTAFNGEWGHNFWDELAFTPDDPPGQLRWEFAQLDPGWNVNLNFNVDLSDPGAPYRWYTNTLEIGPLAGDVNPDDNAYEDVAFSGADLEWIDFDVYRSRVWGCARSTPITVTTALTETVYWDPCWDDGSFPDTFDPGDVITVTTPNMPQPVVAVVPDPFTAYVSGDLDQVWGQIDSLAFEPVEIALWDGRDAFHVETDESGNYATDVDDLAHGAMGDVNYHTEIAYTQVTFHRRMDSLDLVINLDYDSDGVWGNYAPGHTIWITVTESDGLTVKGTQEVTSWNIPWWGGQAGWETDGQAWSPGPGVDIQPFDWVYARADTGSTAEVQVGQITGNVDSANDTIAGTVLAGSWPEDEPLHVQCYPWWSQNQEDDVLPDGNDLYTCSWDPATEWDVLPGDNITVQYWEPDGDAVQANFHEPAPNVNLEKWPQGSGQAYPGGPVVFSLRVQNHGDAVAGPVIVTDTLPLNATYVDDTAPVAPTFPPGQVVWQLASLEPGTEVQWTLYLENEASTGEVVHNVADAWTPNDQDPNNNHAEAEVTVSNELPDLYVNKSPDPGDPAAGQTMLWYIDYGNNGPVASGPAILSDTIPAGTTVVDWWSDQGYGWSVLASGTQLRLEAPSIPGNWGDRLSVRLALEPGLLPGTQLTNTVEIITDPDANPGDNWHQRNDVWVGETRWNASVDKRFGSGRLVPGGEASYNIDARNNGNTPVTMTLTDVLPPGTSFEDAWIWDGRNKYQALPDQIAGNTLTWELGELLPAEYRNLNLTLHIEPDVEVGTALTNCAQVSILEEDGWPFDDGSCATVTVSQPGANLRVVKDYWWNWEGQLQYEITFSNIGTQTLEDVVIADTLPARTHFNGNWWHNFWEGLDLTYNDGSHLEWTIGRLEPGWTSQIYLQADIDNYWIGDEGLSYTNLVEAPLEGDVSPGDNVYEVTAYTGPDVFAEKWLSGGEPVAGEVVTFTIKFGNHNRSPWSAEDAGDPPTIIVDTLPAAMTFITATAPWNPEEGWAPSQEDDNTLVWGIWPMWSDSWWQFDVVVQISDTVGLGDVLVNTVEVQSNYPGYVDPLPGNNVAELALVVQEEGRLRIFLPLISR